MPTPHQALPFSVNLLAADRDSLPEDVSSVVKLRHLHALGAKMEGSVANHRKQES